MRTLVYFERAYLLSEKNLTGEAYGEFRKGFDTSSLLAMDESNISTHLWILCGALYEGVDTFREISEILEWLFKNFPNRLGEYTGIITFVFTDPYMTKLREEDRETYEAISCDLLSFLFKCLEIKHATRIDDLSESNVVYYTRADHLRLLFEDEEEACHYRLPLFHVNHMNDPQEGTLVRQVIGIREKDKSVSGRRIYENDHVYLKSFFKHDSREGSFEFLPMWIQYADDAKGCCVVFDARTFGNHALREVIYMSDAGECVHAGKACDSKRYETIQEGIDSLREIYKDYEIRKCVTLDISKDPRIEDSYAGMDELVDHAMSQISYLFKHETYKHENEVRLIVEENDIEKVRVIGGKVPKVYVYNDSQTYIGEIVLGPKMKEPNNFVNYLYNQCEKMWSSVGKNPVKITKSSLLFR